MAGLLSSVLAGAVGGGGQAVQQNAMSRIDQLRQEALQRATHEFAMERQADQQQFQSGQNEQDRTFRAEQSGLDRNQNRELAEMRERGANARVGAGRNDWQLVPLEGGGYGRYNPRTNQFEEANLPPGAQIGDGGRLSDREKYQLDGIAKEIAAVRKQAGDEMRELTPDEKSRLGQLQSQYDSLLGSSGGGMTPLERLLAGENGAEDGAPAASQGEEGSVQGLVAQGQEERRNTQAANEARRAYSQAREKADAVLSRVEREMAGGASPGGLLSSINEAAGRGGQVSPETMEEAQRVVDEILALEQNANLSDDQKRWLAERLQRLQDAGVPLNLEN